MKKKFYKPALSENFIFLSLLEVFKKGGMVLEEMLPFDVNVACRAKAKFWRAIQVFAKRSKFAKYVQINHI